MPDRFVKNNYFIKIVYTIFLFGLFALMSCTYFVKDFLYIHAFGLNIDLTYVPFMLIGGLFGYFLSLNAYLFLFLIAVCLSSMDAYLLTPYMVITYVFSMFSQYRWFRTRGKTVSSLLYSYFICLFFEALNKDYMIKYDFEISHISALLRHVSVPIYSCLVGCLFFYLFFNYAPDILKAIFPLGYMYTREYVQNLLFQNSLKKTRLSIKITFIIIVEAMLLGFFSIAFIRILFPDLRHMMNDGIKEAQRVGDQMVFRYNNYGIAFTVKMFFMELSIAVPIASNINFFAKMRIGHPIGQLSDYMLKFTDTNEDNRTEFLQTIKESPINTHDEITDLYYSMMITFNEITGYIERMKEEQKLKEDLRIAEAASEAKSSFLSNMSHEIRTPINAVLGMNEMILRESAEPQTLEYAATIQSAGNTLLSLVNDILDFSKIEAGKMVILPVQYNLSSLINDLVNLIVRRANDKNLEFKINIDDNIPDLLFGDEIRIKQCVTNILTNAVKYTEQGHILLDISYEKIEESEIYSSSEGEGSISDSSTDFAGSIALTIKVSDTGIGIKEEDLQKLYSPFERIEEIRNRTIEGTGLGMSIVKKLLALMDTKLVVNSVYGEGSDFSFTVIQNVCSWEPIGDFEKRYKETLSSRTKYHESFTAPDAKILVVDDTSMNLTVIKGLLKNTLVQIVTATSGRETLNLVRQEKYDLIFLDHRMPEMDGVETLEAMQTLEGNINSDTMCIALTANAVAGAREFYLDAGFKDYLSKPIDAARLENMLKEYLPSDKVILSEDTVKNSDNNASSQDDSHIVSSPTVNDIRSKYDNSLIDIEVAIKNCGSEELANEVIEDFKTNLPGKTEAIRQYEASDDIKNFTIQVHSLKSSARIVGAGKLSKLAEDLELMGNKYIESDSEEESALQEIHIKSQELLLMLNDYLDYFALNNQQNSNLENPVTSHEDNSSKPEISADELESAFRDMKELMEAFDYDNAAGIYSMLSDYRIPDELNEKYKLVGKYISLVDREMLLEIL
ncbi:response regulator [Butyrivibrio sp. AE3004]|uniref:response regulator n=1 Tax=Butyrivibrio sp. AE3004 TaxID=1506994 RepID=UPI00069044EE|nr:response regulator [Butyrivibrio sp. AE3004]